MDESIRDLERRAAAGDLEARQELAVALEEVDGLAGAFFRDLSGIVRQANAAALPVWPEVDLRGVGRPRPVVGSTQFGSAMAPGLVLHTMEELTLRVEGCQGDFLEWSPRRKVGSGHGAVLGGCKDNPWCRVNALVVEDGRRVTVGVRPRAPEYTPVAVAESWGLTGDFPDYDAWAAAPGPDKTSVSLDVFRRALVLRRSGHLRLDTS